MNQKTSLQAFMMLTELHYFVLGFTSRLGQYYAETGKGKDKKERGKGRVILAILCFSKSTGTFLSKN